MIKAVVVEEVTHSHIADKSLKNHLNQGNMDEGRKFEVVSPSSVADGKETYELMESFNKMMETIKV